MGRQVGWRKHGEDKRPHSISLTDGSWKELINVLGGQRRLSDFLEQVANLSEAEALKYGRLVITKLPDCPTSEQT
jgi:hypothetical protein